MKANKYYYCKVIQQNYGQGWEDVSEYETDSQGNPKEWSEIPHISPTGKERKQSLLNHDLKEYRLMNYNTRVVQRKKLNS
jgi:hypothetical protein